jgi:hypothetical protein
VNGRFGMTEWLLTYYRNRNLLSHQHLKSPQINTSRLVSSHLRPIDQDQDQRGARQL